MNFIQEILYHRGDVGLLLSRSSLNLIIFFIQNVPLAPGEFSDEEEQLRKLKSVLLS